MTKYQQSNYDLLISLLKEKKFADYKVDISSDDEVLIWRNIDEFLINIIINPDECIAFSKIGKSDKVKKRDFYFVYDEKEFDKIIVDFIN